MKYLTYIDMNTEIEKFDRWLLGGAPQPTNSSPRSLESIIGGTPSVVAPAQADVFNQQPVNFGNFDAWLIGSSPQTRSVPNYSGLSEEQFQSQILGFNLNPSMTNEEFAKTYGIDLSATSDITPSITGIGDMSDAEFARQYGIDLSLTGEEPSENDQYVEDVTRDIPTDEYREGLLPSQQFKDQFRTQPIVPGMYKEVTWKQLSEEYDFSNFASDLERYEKGEMTDPREIARLGNLLDLVYKETTNILEASNPRLTYESALKVMEEEGGIAIENNPMKVVLEKLVIPDIQKNYENYGADAEVWKDWEQALATDSSMRSYMKNKLNVLKNTSHQLVVFNPDVIRHKATSAILAGELDGEMKEELEKVLALNVGDTAEAKEIIKQQLESGALDIPSSQILKIYMDKWDEANPGEESSNPLRIVLKSATDATLFNFTDPADASKIISIDNVDQVLEPHPETGIIPFEETKNQEELRERLK